MHMIYSWYGQTIQVIYPTSISPLFLLHIVSYNTLLHLPTPSPRSPTLTYPHTPSHTPPTPSHTPPTPSHAFHTLTHPPTPPHILSYPPTPVKPSKTLLHPLTLPHTLIFGVVKKKEKKNTAAVSWGLLPFL